jgi:sialic acid synthase
MKKNINQIKFVAEVGCNHQGNLEQAMKMIDTLVNFCDVEYVKFQKRNPKESLSKKKYDMPHPVPANSFGKTYGLHREKLEFSFFQHKKLQTYCKKKNIEYMCSAWDITSLKQLIKLKLKHIKIPSACNNNEKLLVELFKNHNGFCHISLGMTSHIEERNIFRLAKKYKKNKKLILYACTSDYPVKQEDICLLEILRLKKKYEKFIYAIGFSGHHQGISTDIAAGTLGAKWIERHFTLDRTLKGTDHAASLEPDGARRIKRDLALLSKSLKYKKKQILDCELKQRKKLKS